MAVDFSSYLVEALIYLWTFNLGMGDSYDDVVRWVADDAGLDFDALHYGDYGDNDDEYEDDFNLPATFVETKSLDEIMQEGMEILTSEHSKVITDNLLALFTEDYLIEEILDDIQRSPEMTEALNAVYSLIGEWSDGDKVKQALQDNILSYADVHFTKAGEVGYRIGHMYYHYLRPSANVGTGNDAWAVGHRVTVPDSVYEYVFHASIRNIPYRIGYECAFGTFDSTVVADIYVYNDSNHGDNYIRSEDPIYSMDITDFSTNGIDSAARKIADFMSNNRDVTIEIGISLQ